MTEKPVKIVGLEIENVKKVRAISLTPAASGLTIIGGKNYQGKTSVLNSIMAALGGGKLCPANPINDQAERGSIKVELSNGLDVERVFTEKGTRLKITGGEGGQSTLNEFISEFALNLPEFLHATDKKRSKILLQTIGVDLAPFEEKHKKLYADREAIGRLALRQKKHAEAMPYDEEAGTEFLDASSLIAELGAKMNEKQGIEEKLNKVVRAKNEMEIKQQSIVEAQKIVEQRKRALAEAERDLEAIKLNYKSAKNDYEKLQVIAEKPPETLLQEIAEIKKKLSGIDAINNQVRKNLDREKALSEADKYQADYQNYTKLINANKAEMMALLDDAKMPIEGLSATSESITYNGQSWDGMSGAERLIVSAAICQAINPRMGFVLVDGLETMDSDTIKTFGDWLESHDLQAITTRVSDDGVGCDLIIVDGYAELPDSFIETEETEETDEW